ncbi:UNVERIFIED_CONTAM: Phosphoacetylglucosamine mutase [Sesamum calycinum]|uniref:phosphoacetylglucosamine mutase n=1 Tax=Sesamum calycinum TaxID=2727403 RepID=A0AAW2QYU2_9LAMI
MNEQQRSILVQSASRFPPPPGVKFSYGTAGFRADASLLESTVFRVGILAALRSIQTGSVVGLMITASHNKVSDNGVKVADPSGGMLTQTWEPFADALANAADPHSLLQLVDDFVKKENITLEGAPAAEVLLGRDTRPSGMSLLEAAKQVVLCRYYVPIGDLPGLYLLDYIPQGNSRNNVTDKLIVDGADGVGGEKLEKLKTRLGYLTIDVRNYGDGVLNEGVGADYVQKEKVVPRSFGTADAGIRCASLDGDADRLVYFSVLSNSNKIDLVDGDKILSLFALFLKEQLAYANGASTDYLKQLGLEVVLTPTGVKYLHEKAAEYDIGIYFEANGHGTILFSDTFLSWLETRNNELASTSEGSDQHKAALRLLAVSKLINQAVGDALSGLLLVEAILQYMGWSIHKWNELYQDLPSRQLKVKVVDRTAIITANAETTVVRPVGIQEAIDTETAKYPQGRCFIRPSGTEDVVRVYAEASTQEAADNLAHSVVRLVDQYLGFSSS